MVYKVLDLRTGEYFKATDLGWNIDDSVRDDAIFYSTFEAQTIIINVIKNRSYNPHSEVPKLIKEYFEVVEI
jgi:hypothetical protein